MRYISAFLLSFLLLAAAGCSGRSTAAPAAATVLPTMAAPDTGPAGSASSAAIATGRRLLESGGYTWRDSTKAVLAQQMTYAEAARRIPAMTPPQPGIGLPAETQLWLVIFQGQWDLEPMGPPGGTLVPNTYQGCLMILFTAADGQHVASGDTLCPGG